MGFNQNEFMDNAMKATEQRFKDHNDAIERRIWTAPEDVPTVGIIGQMISAHDIKEWKEAVDRAEHKSNNGFYEEGGEITPGMFDGLISYDCNGKPRPFREVHTMNEAKDAVSAGYKPIELEDIMHIRGAVPHFMGHPLPSWEEVERIEAACRQYAASSRQPYHVACSHVSAILSKAQQNEAITDAYKDRMKEVVKQLDLSAQVAQEKAIFGGKVSARAARRSAQSTSFTQTLKKSLNEQKGK